MEPYIKLEKKFAEYLGTDLGVAVNTGTAALQLALLGFGIGEGAEVIVPEFTMAATAFAVTYTGAKPVFVDCGKDLNIDVHKIEEKINLKTRAIMPVHIYGRPANMKAIMKIAQKHNLKVIEDACEAHGAEIDGKRVGSFGDAGCFSFFKNKIISSEEGGFIATNNKDFYRNIQDLKSMAFGDKHDFLHPRLGYNFRITNMQAKEALKKLDDIDLILHKREKVLEMYDRYFKEYRIYRPIGSVPWVYDIILPNKEMRDLWLNKLTKEGIAVRHFFKPMSMQPIYKVKAESLKYYESLKAYDFSERGLYFPLNENITWEMVENIKRIIYG